MLDQYSRFIIDDYGRKPVFANFLPGLSGKKGIPIWAFYCNRGQGITSFGTANKDNSIMEFYPAHTAYQLVTTHGFRTFIRVDGKVREAFQTDEARTRMYIGANTFDSCKYIKPPHSTIDGSPAFKAASTEYFML